MKVTLCLCRGKLELSGMDAGTANQALESEQVAMAAEASHTVFKAYICWCRDQTLRSSFLGMQELHTGSCMDCCNNHAGHLMTTAVILTAS